MFGLEILDVAIGVIFVFLLVSIIVSAVREGLEALMKTRGAYLWLGIRELLHDKNSEGLANAFREHPLIFSLFSGDFGRAPDLKKPDVIASGRGIPSYIPSKNFALALMDIAARGPITEGAAVDATAPLVSLESIRHNIANIQNASVQRALLTAVDAAQGDFNRAQMNIEAWYNSAMDRVSGWYKRSTHWWLFWIGFFVAVGMNVNTLLIVDHLYQTPAVREAIVKRAEAYVKTAQTPAAEADEKYEKAKEELLALDLPIGWAPEMRPAGAYQWVASFVGWLLTAFAATFGAPFWFDLLNKIMVIRSTVKPHEKSLEEGSEDRQAKTVTTPVTVPVTTTTGPNAAAPPPSQPQPLPAASPAEDIEADAEACGAVAYELSSDVELPESTGGVQ